MFKRRDWRLFNRDDGNSSSDTDSDVDNDGRGALDESDDDSGASSSKSGSENGSGSGSEHNADESDSESGDDDDEVAGDRDGEETLTVTTRTIEEHEAGDDTQPVPSNQKHPDPSKGIAVKCSVCPGVLCLSEKSLQQHLDSKRHKKAMAKQDVGVDDEDVLVDAAASGRRALAIEAANRRANGDESDSLEGYSDGEAETHAERLARLRIRRVLSRESPPADSDDEDGAAREGKKGGGRQRQRSRAKKATKEGGAEDGAEVERRERKKGKPGKRQREALRGAAVGVGEEKNSGDPRTGDEETREPGDTRPRKNRAKRAAEAVAGAETKPAKRGAYDFNAGDLLAPRPSVDRVRGDLKQMRSGRGAGRGGGRGGGGGGGRGRGGGPSIPSGGRGGRGYYGGRGRGGGRGRY
jgi:hypothetical protein